MGGHLAREEVGQREQLHLVERPGEEDAWMGLGSGLVSGLGLGLGLGLTVKVKG